MSSENQSITSMEEMAALVDRRNTMLAAGLPRFVAVRRGNPTRIEQLDLGAVLGRPELLKREFPAVTIVESGLWGPGDDQRRMRDQALIAWHERGKVRIAIDRPADVDERFRITCDQGLQPFLRRMFLLSGELNEASLQFVLSTLRRSSSAWLGSRWLACCTSFAVIKASLALVEAAAARGEIPEQKVPLPASGPDVTWFNRPPADQVILLTCRSRQKNGMFFSLFARREYGKIRVHTVVTPGSRDSGHRVKGSLAFGRKTFELTPEVWGRVRDEVERLPAASKHRPLAGEVFDCDLSFEEIAARLGARVG